MMPEKIPGPRGQIERCRPFRIFAAGALLAAALLPACATATIEDAVPQGALEKPADAAVPADEEVAVSSGEAKDTGEYPNLNEQQRGELAQMTPAEKAAYLAELKAARAEQASAGGANRSGPGTDLKRLARAQQDEALKKIEAGPDDEE